MTLRCHICDFCSSAELGSGYSPFFSTRNRVFWSDKHDGFICSECDRNAYEATRGMKERDGVASD